MLKISAIVVLGIIFLSLTVAFVIVVIELIQGRVPMKHDYDEFQNDRDKTHHA